MKLAGNISISTMAGTDNANYFQGTFDGDGHTLTVNYNTSEPRTAPFRHVKNAVIRNLTVAGTITTSAQFAAGVRVRPDVLKYVKTVTEGNTTKYVYAYDGLGFVIEAQVDAVQTRHGDNARTSAWGRTGA